MITINKNRVISSPFEKLSNSGDDVLENDWVSFPSMELTLNRDYRNTKLTIF